MHEVRLLAETLAADLRDAILAHVQRLTKPWASMSEAEQLAAANQATADALSLVKETVKLVAKRGFATADVTIGKIAADHAAIRATVTLPSTGENFAALVEAQGSEAVLVFADPHEYYGAETDPEVSPDQPALEFEDDPRPSKRKRKEKPVEDRIMAPPFGDAP